LPTKAAAADRVEQVGRILQDYADRAVFRGFSPGRKNSYKLLWHRDRFFELHVNPRTRTLRFPTVLPQVEAAMYRDFQQFVASRTSSDVPEHRRIDTNKLRVRCGNRAGNVSLTATVLDEDYEYATRKLIHLVHETYVAFLMDGPYYEYMVEVFDLDPDHM